MKLKDYTTQELKDELKRRTELAKYEQALAKARELMDKGYDVLMPEIFPELNESEDEKIKREIVAYINELADLKNEKIPTKWLDWLEKQDEQKPTLPKWKYKKDNIPLLKDSLILNKYGCVAKSPSGAIVSDVWVLDYDELAKLPKEKLEKQGENKPTDKVEPKFKPGDWIVFNGLTLHIDEVVNGYYRTTSRGDGIHNSYDWNIDNAARLWTIKDAKDGDVLATDKSVFIYAKVLYNKPYAYCGVDKFGVFKDNCLENDWSNSVDNIHPATKEQYDLLFQTMKEAGYKWDSGKKELKTIGTKKVDANDVLPYLGNNQIQDILEDMGMLDDNGQCPHTAEEIFKAGMEYAYNINHKAFPSVMLNADTLTKVLTKHLYTCVNKTNTYVRSEEDHITLSELIAKIKVDLNIK